MLRACNNTLQTIEGLQYESLHDEDTINHLLLLNRYSQDFVLSAQSVPVEHWGDVLMRMNKTDCNYVVTGLVLKAVLGPEQNLPLPLNRANGGLTTRSI
jgi:hypothetical protein